MEFADMTPELTNRVERLERRLKWIVGGWILSITLLVMLFLVPRAQTAQPPERLTLRSLAVIDEKGIERIRIAAPLPDATEGGKPQQRRSPASGIQLNDANGNERGGLAMLDDGTLTLCFDSKSAEAACMYVMPSGERGFVVTDDRGKDRAQLVISAEGTPQLLLKDNTERTRANLRVPAEGSPEIRLLNEKGNAVWSAP
jgi:hypothetical protein